jgi:putative SOS response-associated peptidase YedK
VRQIFHEHYSRAIITRDAVGEIRDIHDRMPCVLKAEVYRKWLDTGNRDVHGFKEMQNDYCVDDFVISRI